MVKMWSWVMWSNAPAKSASKTNSRFGLLPFATAKQASIAS
jgi:hypothetical protein